MADQEVIKHTKKIYSIWSSKEHSFWHKAKEFVLEILIIVFAVSLSIWLHGRSEHAHQMQDVKEFLIGLKSDLKNDITEMKSDRETFIQSRLAFKYITGLKMNQKANPDSLSKYGSFFFNETGLVPNNGRFEGFKSSGKIGTIEDIKLQNNLMDLYQENIPILVLYTNYYSKKKSALNDYFNRYLKRTSDTTNNYIDLFSSDEAQNMGRDLAQVSSIVNQYSTCIRNMEEIIARIDQTYGKDAEKVPEQSGH